MKFGKRFKRFAAGGIIIVTAAVSGIGYQIDGAPEREKGVDYRETSLQFGTLSLTFEEEGTTQRTTHTAAARFFSGGGHDDS